MICLEVTKNGNRLCTAGVADGLLSGDLMWGNHATDSPSWSLSLYVGGVTGETAIEWVRDNLAVGDIVTFRVVEAIQADPARPSTLHDPDWSSAADLAWARQQHVEFTRRLHELEQQYGDRLVKDRDA